MKLRCCEEDCFDDESELEDLLGELAEDEEEDDDDDDRLDALRRVCCGVSPYTHRNRTR